MGRDDPRSSGVPPDEERTESPGDGQHRPVSVRFTESVVDGHPIFELLHQTGAVIEFPSLAASSEFDRRLGELTDGTDLRYYLTPDHTSDGETFFLRCRDPERGR